jgi:hypothetical protein
METIIKKIKSYSAAYQKIKDIEFDWSKSENWSETNLSYPYITYNLKTGAKKKYYFSFHCLSAIFGYTYKKSSFIEEILLP